MRVSSPRRLFAFAALVSLSFFSLSCGGDSGDPSPTPTSVLVTPGADTLLSVGETQAFVAVVLDADGDPIDDAEISWSSTVPGIVSIDPVSGIATAVANGSAQVQASSGTLEGTAPVTVAQVPTTVTVMPATGNFTFVGDTLTFTATVLDAGGSPVTPLQKIWTLNDNTVAVIDSNGLARAKGPGLAMVTLVAIGPGGAKAGYAAVSSTQPVASLHIRNQPTSMIAGEAFNPAVQVEVRDSGGAVVTGYTGAITLGVDSGPLGAVLRGTRQVHAINGVSSFSGLSLEKAGQHLLGASATDLAPDQSAPIAIVAAAAHHLSIISEPVTVGGAVVAGDTIPIVATIVDRFENRILGSTTPVNLQFISGPSGSGLYGDPAGDHHPDGTITFPTAHLELAMVGYVLGVWGVGLLPDTTNVFGVLHAAPHRVRISGDSGLRVGSPVEAPTIQVQIEDLYENQVTIDTVPVMFEASWPFAAPAGKGQLVSRTDTLQVVGQAFVSDFYVSRPGPTALIAHSPGLLSDTGEAYHARFAQPSIAWVGPGQVCIFDRYCVGANDHGELGVDPALLTEDSVFVPIDTIMDDFGPLAFSATSVCSVDYVLPGSIPTVMCRGANDEGQLGRGTTGADDHQFVRLTGATGWWTVAMGTAHGCALTADSTAACWGRNDHGQLGRGTTSANEPTPAAVSGGAKFKALAAGGDHTCGVTVAGGMLCWGANASGQLGDSTTTESNLPVSVVGAYTWAEVAVGASFTCGVKTNAGRKVLCWGDNTLAQLGDAGAGTGRIYPGLVSGGLNDLPFGLVAGSAHACTDANGVLLCWGDDSRGQIGNGAPAAPVSSPYGVSLPQGGQLVSIAVGGNNTCAVRYLPALQRQTLLCWGANDRGQLGTGNTLDQATPAEPLH